jgi:hypothetical protein
MVAFDRQRGPGRGAGPYQVLAGARNTAGLFVDSLSQARDEPAVGSWSRSSWTNAMPFWTAVSTSSRSARAALSLSRRRAYAVVSVGSPNQK